MRKRTKRKIKKLYRKSSKSIIFLTSFIVILFMTVGYAYLRTELDVSGKGTIDQTPTSEDDKTEVCEGNITYTIENQWTGNVIINLVIENNGNSEYHSWVLKLKGTGYNITTSSAQVKESNGDTYLSNMTWNSSILPGESLAFQVQFTTDKDIDTIMQGMVINACGAVQDSGDNKPTTITQGNASMTLGQLEVPIKANITLQEAGGWGGTVNLYNVEIENNSNYDITEWRGVIAYGDHPYESSYPWNATNDSEKKQVTFSNTYGLGELAIGEKTTQTYTLVLRTTDPNYIPDIVVAGLKAN